MRKRLRSWRKYFLAFLVLTFIAGPIGLVAQDALQAKYERMYYQGAGVGIRVGYGYGLEEGNKQGYIAGFDTGRSSGYLAGLGAMDDPYHKAALAFEQRNPYADVLDGMYIEYSGGEDAVGYIVHIPATLGAANVELLMHELQRLAKSMYNGETYFMLWLAWKDPLYGIDVVQGWAFPYELFIQKGFEVTREEGLIFLVPFPIQLPIGWTRWPGHPYTEAQVTSGDSNVNQQ